MKNIGSGSGITVFVLFFGIALFEAIQNRSWLRAAFWLAIGAIFALADTRRQRENT